MNPIFAMGFVAFAANFATFAMDSEAFVMGFELGFVPMTVV